MIKKSKFRYFLLALTATMLMISIVSCKNDEIEGMKTESMNNEAFLKVQGKNIYTKSGQGDLVQLRGVNIGGYLLQEFWMTPTRPSNNVVDELSLLDYLENTYGESRADELIDIYQEYYFGIEDFDRLDELGINVIRLPFWYRNLVDQSGKVKEDWYNRFDWFIEEAGRRGIYVILDFHGAPGSQNGSDHSGVDGGDAKEEASEFFFSDEKTVSENQELFFSLWEMIAARYKGNPVVAGYDLLNEPYCTYRYDSIVSVQELHEDLWSVYDEAYQRIRKIDEDHIIIMEATWDPIDLPNPMSYNWENVVYEYHNYLYDDYQNKEGRQISNMEHKLKLIKSANYNVPSLMGEFNYFDSYDAWDEGLELLNSSGIHWTLWTYKTTSDYGNWGLYHHTSGDLNIERVDDIKLESFWKRVGNVRANQALLDVITKHFTDEIVEAK